MNEVAANVTGWSREEAISMPVAGVFHIINEQTRERVESPVDKVLKSGKVAGLANHIRTPLTPVLATLNRWEMTHELPADVRDDVEMVRRSVEL
jgi:hypothetical protein